MIQLAIKISKQESENVPCPLCNKSIKRITKAPLIHWLDKVICNRCAENQDPELFQVWRFLKDRLLELKYQSEQTGLDVADENRELEEIFTREGFNNAEGQT